MKQQHKLYLFVQEQMTVGYRKTFGSGTKLYVTEKGKDQVKAPTLFGYLPSKKDEKKSDGHGKQTMLCQASGMFPDLVKFAWKKKDAGKWGDVSEGDVVEQRNDGQEVTVTSMLIVDKDKARNDDYQCTVVHEGKTKELEMKRENSKPAKESKDDDQITATCPPLNTEEPIKMQISGDSEQIPKKSWKERQKL
ncbi:hypothetical protein cypCar_00001016 [Cyprinus carpio]|nr:hypothetical protein cypCar_00001016 [Cyprinus carpio]